MQRQLTVRVDMQASGNLDQRLDAAASKADRLKGSVAAAGRMPAVVTAPPRVAPAAQGTSFGQGFSLFQSVLGKFTFGLSTAAAATVAVVSAFDTLGDRAVLAANSLQRASIAEANVASALGGNRMTRQQYEQLDPAFRRLFEMAGPGSQMAMLTTELGRVEARLRQFGPGASAQGAAIQQGLESAGAARINWFEALWQRGGRAFVGAFSLEALSTARESMRRDVMEAQLRSEGVSASEIASRFERLRREGTRYGGENLTLDEINQLARIMGGQRGAVGAAQELSTLQQLLRGQRPPSIVPGLDEAQRQIDNRFMGINQAGALYESILRSIGNQDQVDREERMLQLTESIQSILNTRLPTSP